MGQINGQIDIFTYIKELNTGPSTLCAPCICNGCLYFNSGRCPHGECYDDKRAKDDPYDKAHPGEPPRTGWSNWKTDQAFWCRGGTFYPVHYCENFVKYQEDKNIVRECLLALVHIYQDGYVRCSIVDTVGCEECYKRFLEKEDLDEKAEL